MKIVTKFRSLLVLTACGLLASACGKDSDKTPAPAPLINSFEVADTLPAAGGSTEFVLAWSADTAASCYLLTPDKSEVESEASLKLTLGVTTEVSLSCEKEGRVETQQQTLEVVDRSDLVELYRVYVIGTETPLSLNGKTSVDTDISWLAIGYSDCKLSVGAEATDVEHVGRRTLKLSATTEVSLSCQSEVAGPATDSLTIEVLAEPASDIPVIRLSELPATVNLFELVYGSLVTNIVASGANTCWIDEHVPNGAGGFRHNIGNIPAVHELISSMWGAGSYQLAVSCANDFGSATATVSTKVEEFSVPCPGGNRPSRNGSCPALDGLDRDQCNSKNGLWDPTIEKCLVFDLLRLVAAAPGSAKINKCFGTDFAPKDDAAEDDGEAAASDSAVSCYEIQRQDFLGLPY